MEPWGTPSFRGAVGDLKSWTDVQLSFKEVYEENQERAVLEIPQLKGEE